MSERVREGGRAGGWESVCVRREWREMERGGGRSVGREGSR